LRCWASKHGGGTIAVSNRELCADVGSDTLCQEFNDPEGGLYGHAAVYNPTDGTYFTYNATALEQLNDDPV
jgi:hypothetical protein